MKEDSIPDINIDIDPFNCGGYHSKYITTPDGKKARVNIKVTGDLFKELQKHKFVVNKDTITYKQPFGNVSSSESVNQLFGVAETYRKSLPLSERLFMWLKTKRNKNKLFNKIYDKWLKNQQKKFFFETNITSEEYEKIKALGGQVIMALDTEGKQLFVPIEKVDGGFKLPDGYKIQEVKDGINVPGFSKQKDPFDNRERYAPTPKPKAEKYSPSQPSKPDTVTPKEAIKQESKQPPFGVNIEDVAKDLPKFDEIYKKAQEANKFKHAGSTTEVQAEHFGDLTITSVASNITTKIDELPANWEYQSKEMGIVRTSFIEDQDIINTTVEIIDYSKDTLQYKHTTDNTNDLTK